MEMYDGLSVCWQITGQALLGFSIVLLLGALVGMSLQGHQSQTRLTSLLEVALGIRKRPTVSHARGR